MKIQGDPTLGTVAGGSAAPTGAAAATQRRTEVGAHGAPDDGVHGAASKPAATVAISARSRELHEALRLAKASDDVRPEVVKQIKTMVDNGTYVLDPSAIASGMLDRKA
jgi:flagellar biosynthesis anti-sigma factor FlgM